MQSEKIPFRPVSAFRGGCVKFLFLFLWWTGMMVAAFSAFAEEDCVPPHAVILIYHHVSSDTPASTSVTPEIFDQHLNYLSDNGFRVLDLPTVVNRLKTGQDLPDSVVVLTFDDGYESVYTEAFPRLKKRGWPFTVFVSPQTIPDEPGLLTSWEQLREMDAAGATIASHGLHHGFMNRQKPDEDQQTYRRRLEEELKFANQRISDEISSLEDLVAYPYGEYSPDVQAVVEKLGLTALGQQSGAAGPNSDFTCLPRFPMAAGFASLENFGDKVSSLPMPTSTVMRVDPNLDPEEAAKAAPTLTLMLDMSCLGEGDVDAFASGAGRIPSWWVDRESGFLQVQAPNPLPQGRSRYNLTARVPGTRRWYWFSQVWIVGQEHLH
jgi:peptidoglycan/xylan/chitin deacetylase (PgdA/CDA1 family)